VAVVVREAREAREAQVVLRVAAVPLGWAGAWGRAEVVAAAEARGRVEVWVWAETIALAAPRVWAVQSVVAAA
jgi:hypothetical protein